VPVSVRGAAPAIAAADAGSDDDEQLPAGYSHEIRAMLFADAVGYSKLSEDQTLNFITQFWGAVADLNSRTAQPPDHVETTGDGLYMVFRGVGEAGRYALELSELVTRTDWSARGLPCGMNIRIALHSGPVYRGRNPVTGSPIYTGPHTSRTARIEPITPPGQVYASSAFAAVAAANGVGDLSLSYVGRMPLAKDYGVHDIYHVASAIPLR
jgi:adenylate cyclase